MNKKLIIPIVAVILIVVIAGYLISTNYNGTNETSIKTFNATGYSFSYPGNWTVSNVSSSNSTDEIIRISKGSDTYISIQKSPLGGLDAEQALSAQNVMPDNYQKVSTNNLTVDGNTAYQTIYTVNSNGKTYKQANIEFAKDGNIYFITFEALESTFDQDKAVLDSFISSFKVQ